MSAESLTFESTDEWTAPASQKVAVSITGRAITDVHIFVEVEGSGVRAGLTTATLDELTVSANEPFLLSPGVHSASIKVTACVPGTNCTQQLEGSPKTIPVTYVRRGLGSTPGSLQHAVRNGASQADRTRALSVIGYPEQAWIATTNRPWLRLSRSSGSTADTTPIDVFIDESGGTIANGRYEALIRIETPLYNRSIVATIEVDRTQVNTVAPYLGVLFDQREVIIRGTHLDSGEITGVQFGGTDATSFRVVSASEIRATTPGSLSTGSHAITLTGGAASAVSTANFEVVPPSFLSSTHMPLPSPAAADAEPIAIAYDAPGKRIFVAVDQPAGMRDFVAGYTYQSGTSWFRGNAYTGYDTIRAMTLALDGRSLLLSEDEVIYDVGGAPTSGIAVSNLMFDGARYATLYSNGWATNFVSSIAVANDGRAVLVAAADAGAPRSTFQYSSLSPVVNGTTWDAPRLERLNPAGTSESALFERGVAGAAADGSRVLIAGSAAPGDVYEYDAASGSLRRTNQVMAASAIQLDRTGGRILLNNTDVYDRDFQLLGHLPSDTVAAVFSPTVGHVYAYNSNGQLSSFDVSGTNVTPIATWSPGTSAGDPQKRIVMTITAEGWTLLIAGTAGVSVEFIPDHAR